MIGGAERVAHINSPPPPRFGPSVKAYFLVHVSSLHLSTIPFVLVSNFPFVLTLRKLRTCLGYHSRKICQTSAFGFLSPQRSHQLSLTSNSEVSNPTDSALRGKSKRCPFHLKDILKLLVVFGRAKIRFRSFTQF